MKSETEIKRIVYRSFPLHVYTETKRTSDSLVFYVKGGHRFAFADISLIAEEGNMVYIPYGSSYTNYTLSDDTEYFQVDFLTFRNGIANALFDAPRKFEKKVSAEFVSFFRDIYKTYSHRKEGYELLCISNLLKIIGMIRQNEKKANFQNTTVKKIEKTLNHINEFYYMDTSVDKLAEISQMSVSNLEKLFKKHLDVSPIVYRNKIRCEQAKLLLAGGYSVTVTAEKVGYSDVYYFCRIFKKICGITPGQYAQKNSTV